MEVISIDGVEYEKVTTLAKRFKYTTDYIGQLCRAGKVEAKLIGRTWYVHEPSLQNHKKVRYQKNSQNDKSTEDVNKIKISRIDVPPVISKNTAKSIVTAPADSRNFARRLNWKPVKYDNDTSSLLPDLTPRLEKDATTIPVELAEGVVLPIDTVGPSKTALIPDDLPTVLLQGVVPVSSIDSYFDNSEENIASSIPTRPDVVPSTKARGSRKIMMNSGGRSTREIDPERPKRYLDAGITKPVTIEQIRPLNINNQPVRVEQAPETEITSFPWSWLIVLLVLTVVGIFIITTVDFFIAANVVSFSSTFVFSVPIKLVHFYQEVINIF